ncbi:MAG: sigma-70 family RNA polymerase sigma factor [Cytophagales bacterium]
MEDNELVNKCQQEETKNQAFAILVDRYQKKVYWLVRKMVIDHDEADDLTQDIFVKVWKNLSGFKGDSKLFTWIYRIAVNECLNHLSNKRKRFFIPMVDVEKEMSRKIDSGLHISGDEIQIKLQKAILTLPEKQRLVFNMKYFEEMKYEEIAEVLGTSVGALKASYHHAVKKIEDYMSRN